MKELKFPLIGVIYHYKGIKEENCLYTPDELNKRDPKLAEKCMKSKIKWELFDSEMGTNNKTIIGCRLDDRTMLYDFLKGKYNDDTYADDEDWYWENSTSDVYGESLHADTMELALDEFNSRLEKSTLLTISTAHIRKSTSEWLGDQIKSDISSLTVINKNDSGFFIYMPECDEKTYKEIPDDLRACMEFAKENGAQLLCLDSDGPVMEYDGLEVYQW